MRWQALLRILETDIMRADSARAAPRSLGSRALRSARAAQEALMLSFKDMVRAVEPRLFLRALLPVRRR